MKIFKFGGASVKDANAVKNVADIIKLYNNVKLVIVISAMGKTTNALVELTNAYFFKQPEKSDVFDSIKKYHYEIIESLFPDKNHPVYKDINNSFYEIEILLNIDPPIHHNLIFDKIVSYGESLSTKIVSHYLNFVEIKNIWFDATEVIKTDNTFKEGKVDWRQTEKLVKTKLLPLFECQVLTPDIKNDIVITQGFVAKSHDGNIVTLGREGSDYSAAILAYCLDAEEVVIWKDVPGVLNADPKWFDETIKLDRISYFDAAELAYYGATVIHHKTIKPLQNKRIPLRVKSFNSPSESGTLISYEDVQLAVPSFIFRIDQTLIVISPKDFSFIIEENLRDVFHIFASCGVKINVMQNTAISFSVSVDYDESKIPMLIEKLKEKFNVSSENHALELITIRNYDQQTIDRVCVMKEILLEQRTKTTAQLVVRKLD